jgi:hypothetical protein
MTVPPVSGGEAWPPEPADLAPLTLLAEVVQLVLCVQTATTPDGVRAALRTMSARGIEPSRHVVRAAVARLLALDRQGQG